MADKRLRKAATFIGLDLAWSPRNRTGGAVIRNGRLIASSGQLGDNSEIFTFVATHLAEDAPAVVAVDAPLRVPNESGSRTADRALSRDWRRFQAGALPTNRTLLGRMNRPQKSVGERENEPREPVVRGEQLVEMLVRRLRFSEEVPVPKQSAIRTVCEVFPHPAHVSLFGLEKTLKYKARSGRSYEERWAAFEVYQRHLRTLRKADPPLKKTKALLCNVDVRMLRGKALKEYEDRLDAITCAYVASYVWHHGPRLTRLYGSASEGHILVPLTKPMRRRLK